MPAELSYFCTALSSACFNKIPCFLVSLCNVSLCQGRNLSSTVDRSVSHTSFQVREMLLEAGVARSTWKEQGFAKESSITLQHSPMWARSLPI